MSDWHRLSYNQITRTFSNRDKGDDEARDELNILRLLIVKAGLVGQVVATRHGNTISLKVPPSARENP